MIWDYGDIATSQFAPGSAAAILSISYKQIKGFVKVVLVFTSIVFSIIQFTLTG